jgi:hypothetical protein
MAPFAFLSDSDQGAVTSESVTLSNSEVDGAQSLLRRTKKKVNSYKV